MKYVCYFRKDGKEDQTLEFEIFDTPIAQAWIDVIRPRLEMGHTTPLSPHGAFPKFDNISDTHYKMKRTVRSLQDMGVRIEWPEDEQDITRELLNRLHEQFHMVEEEILKDPAREKDVTMFDLREQFRTVNYLIHNLESLLDNAVSLSHWVWQVDTDLQNRVALTDEMRREFRWQYFNNYHPCGLVLGYATIGKHLGHAFWDNDIEIIERNMLRPQLNIHTETIMVYEDKQRFDSPQQADQAHQQHIQDITDWLQANNISTKVNMGDPKNHAYIQPRIGQCADPNITEEDVYKLFNQWDFYRVGLVDD